MVVKIYFAAFFFCMRMRMRARACHCVFLTFIRSYFAFTQPSFPLLSQLFYTGSPPALNLSASALTPGIKKIEETTGIERVSGMIRGKNPLNKRRRPYASMHIPIKLTIIDRDRQNSSHAIPPKYIVDAFALFPPKKNLAACCTPISITTPIRKNTWSKNKSQRGSKTATV